VVPSITQNNEGILDGHHDGTPTAATTTSSSSNVCGCNWDKSFIGCLFKALPTKDGCSAVGCQNMFHHGCQTEWEMKQYERDDPKGAVDIRNGVDGADCLYDSHGSFFCMYHHPHSAVALEMDSTDVLMSPTPTSTVGFTTPTTGSDEKQKTAKSIKKKVIQTPVEKQKDKEKLIQWAKSMTIEHVKLTADNNDVVESLGGRSWDLLDKTTRLAFIKESQIQVPQQLRGKGNLGKAIINHINAKSVQGQIIAPNKKKSKNAATKPACITKAGTLFRAANVLTSEPGRPCYIETKNCHDRDDQDTRTPKATPFDTLACLYNSNDSAYDVFSDNGKSLIGHNVARDVCTDFDVLSSDDFRAVVAYMNAHYRDSRNRKNVTGRNKPFDHYCEGKSWLLYFHRALEETGDGNLLNCAYSELVESITRTSTDKQFKPLTKRNRKRGSVRTDSISPTPQSSRNKKQAAAEATEAAAYAIEDRQLDLQDSETMDRLFQLKEKVMDEQSQLDRRVYKYDKAKKAFKNNDINEYTLSTYKAKRKKSKMLLAIYTKEYERLKEKTNYKSPDVSSESSSSDSSEYESDEGDPKRLSLSP